ncbi:hypothetical protein RXV86_00085 [Alisedimentitalea sp. MJ-SS2]|uniref:hypothetical protein n=1 Tax=Aliisedimentitalea sp. MJ-SS2 TaxID=3049795 RepID=UPI00290D2AC6|nr:hypothetical protein [Alisedimentitalea sp. MJ-SS2]MDU8925773.1 hypothetical protein [Alisedimentitalea sp. MJ-SS2]
MSALGPQMGGDIRVQLDIADSKVAAAHVVSTRTPQAARLFVGRSAADVLQGIGGVYSLCGRAQSVAAVRAVEAALGVTVAPEVEAGRDSLRLAEMITQTAMRLALYWPRALGLVPEPELVRLSLAVEQAVERDVLGGAAWKVPGSGVAASSAAMHQQIDRLTEAADTYVRSCALRDEVLRRGLAGFGLLPEGMAPEEGPFKRNWDDQGVAEVRASHGPGLLARLEASLTDLFLLQGRLPGLISAVDPVAAQRVEIGTGRGEAVVETARGPLRHVVTVKDGIVADYVIDAPTEVNFRPGGPVEVGLIGAGADGIEFSARLHVLAIDPCVEFEIEVRHA